MATDDTRPHLFYTGPLPLGVLSRVASHLSNTSQPVSQTTLAHIARCSKQAYRIAQPQFLYSTLYLDVRFRCCECRGPSHAHRWPR